MGVVRKASLYSAAAFAMAMALVGVTIAPALAGYGEAYHGKDWAYFSGYVAWVSDEECDGNRVTAEYKTVNGNLFWFSDDDGCAGGPSWRNSWDGSYITKIRVCEATKGCSAWAP
jgi:hypothetical protein